MASDCIIRVNGEVLIELPLGRAEAHALFNETLLQHDIYDEGMNTFTLDIYKPLFRSFIRERVAHCAKPEGT